MTSRLTPARTMFIFASSRTKRDSKAGDLFRGFARRLLRGAGLSQGRVRLRQHDRHVDLRLMSGPGIRSETCSQYTSTPGPAQRSIGPAACGVPCLRCRRSSLRRPHPGATGSCRSTATTTPKDLSIPSAGSAPSHSYRFHQLSDGQRALMVLYPHVVFETIPDTGSPDDSGKVPRTLFLDEPDNYVQLLPELQPWLAELEDGAGDTLPQNRADLAPSRKSFSTSWRTTRVWLDSGAGRVTSRIIDAKNDTDLIGCWRGCATSRRR